MPAQLTEMCKAPAREVTFAIASRTDVSLATSTCKAWMPPSRNAGRRAWSRSKPNTVAPPACSTSQVARPRPDPAPVTMAISPCSSMALSFRWQRAAGR
jgi:hypothetical protein